MARDGDVLFTVVTPTTGNRPKALQQAIRSVEESAAFAGLSTGQLEILVGFDGKKGTCPVSKCQVRCFTLPPDNDWGNGIRNMLLKIARGEKILFLDDDNIIKPYTLSLYLKHFDAEMIIGKIDTQLAFDKPHLPEIDSGSLIRPGNIDPLCLCLSRRLVIDRCGGWNHPGKYESDYLNILDWHRRAHSVTVLEEVVGVYDWGRSLDANALTRRQSNMLDRLATERGVPMGKIGRPSVAALCTASG